MLQKFAVFLLFLWPALLFAEESELYFYQPFIEIEMDGRSPSLSIIKKSGQCLQQSQRIKREDTWACLADGKHYDPCFVKRFGSQNEVLCLESPWTNEAVQITVDIPLNNYQHEVLDMSKTYPWAIELISGEQCLAIQSDEVYDNLPVRYRCTNHKVLIGHIQRCSPAWKILQRDPTGITTGQIRKAWF